MRNLLAVALLLADSDGDHTTQAMSVGNYPALGAPVNLHHETITHFPHDASTMTHGPHDFGHGHGMPYTLGAVVEPLPMVEPVFVQPQPVIVEQPVFVQPQPVIVEQPVVVA